MPTTKTYTASSYTSDVWRVYATLTTDVADAYVSVNLDASGIDVKASKAPSNSMTFTLSGEGMSASYVFPAKKREGGTKGTKYPAPSFSGTTYVEIPRGNEDRTVELRANLLNTSGATSTVSILIDIPKADIKMFEVHYYDRGDEIIDVAPEGTSIALRGETFYRGRWVQTAWTDDNENVYTFGQTVSGVGGEILYLYPEWEPKEWEQTVIDAENSAYLRRRFDIEIEVGWADEDGDHSVLFDETQIVSATISLRGLEDTLDNPSLQASEIEAKIVTDIAFEELDINESNSYIKYRAGYRYWNEWGEWRTFYGSSRFTREDLVVNIQGIDGIAMLENYATKSEVFSSYTCRSGHPEDKWAQFLMEKLDSIGIPYEKPSTFEGDEEGSLIQSFSNLRELIAALMNATNHDGSQNQVVIYKDAGRPELIVGGTYREYLDSFLPLELFTCSKPERIIEDRVHSVGFSHFDVHVATTPETIKTQSVKVNTIYEESAEEGKYYKDITASRGARITSDATSITYKAESSGTNTTKGYLAELSDFSEFRLGSSCFCASSIGLEADDCQLVLPAIYGTLGFTLEAGAPLKRMLESWSNVSYKYIYRGDPRLEPNTPILIGDDEHILMSVTTIHENGGTYQELITKKRYREEELHEQN